jgi:hypothetical protein
MNTILTLLAAAFGVVLGVVIGVGLLVPAVGNAIYGPLNPRRIVNLHHHQLAIWLWIAMSCTLVLVSTGSLTINWWLIGLGLICACAAVGCGVCLRLSLAREARQQRVAQEAAFREELEQVLRNEH